MHIFVSSALSFSKALNSISDECRCSCIHTSVPLRYVFSVAECSDANNTAQAIASFVPSHRGLSSLTDLYVSDVGPQLVAGGAQP